MFSAWVCTLPLSSSCPVSEALLLGVAVWCFPAGRCVWLPGYFLLCLPCSVRAAAGFHSMSTRSLSAKKASSLVIRFQTTRKLRSDTAGLCLASAAAGSRGPGRKAGLGPVSRLSPQPAAGCSCVAQVVSGSAGLALFRALAVPSLLS